MTTDSPLDFWMIIVTWRLSVTAVLNVKVWNRLCTWMTYWSVDRRSWRMHVLVKQWPDFGKWRAPSCSSDRCAPALVVSRKSVLLGILPEKMNGGTIVRL